MIFSTNSFSQTIETIKKSEKLFTKKGKDFAFLESPIDTATLEFVATIKATGRNKKEYISSLYFAIMEKAKTMGANSFRMHSFLFNDSSKIYSLSLDTYFSTDSLLQQNFELHEKNMVFIFGDEKIDGKETQSFKVNGLMKNIKSGTYYREELREGNELKITKGRITGMTVWLNWKPKRQSAFYTLTGFGLGGSTVPAGVIGMSFNTGRLTNIDGNLGTLLTQILKQ